MKRSLPPVRSSVVVIACCGLIGASLERVHAQGSLTPPGAPAPTMKSLDQVEPRTPITSLPYTISASGSYYLTGNLTGAANSSTAGITVSVDNVTIDLNGFTLTGGSGNSTAGIVTTSGRTNLVVRNGTLSNWTSYGVSFIGSVARFETLRALSCGGGLVGGSNCSVIDCTVLNNAGVGIATSGQSQVVHCVSQGNGSIGIKTADDCSVLQCDSSGNTSNGIQVGNSGVVANCVANGNTNQGIVINTNGTVDHCTASSDLNGIATGAGCTVQACTVGASSGYGIEIGDYSSALHCTASNNGSTGLTAYNSSASTYATGCTIADCTSGNSYSGFGVGYGCTVRGCTARGNTHSGILILGNGNQILGNTADTDNKANDSGSAGIYLSGNNNRIESNALTANLVAGLAVGSGSKGNLIIRNSFATTAYTVQSGDTIGPLINMASGGSITNTSPWANFYTDN